MTESTDEEAGHGYLEVQSRADRNLAGAERSEVWGIEVAASQSFFWQVDAETWFPLDIIQQCCRPEKACGPNAKSLV